jgi:integrase
MASITNEPGGRRTIQFIAPDGKRRSIRLGKMSKRNAQAIQVKVEDLVASALTGFPPSDETSRWLKSLDQSLFDKLARAGLVRQRPSAMLGPFLDDYIASRRDVKESTRIVYRRVRRYLIDYFGKARHLRSIPPGDADLWRLDLIAQGKADNTVRRSCGVAKQFFTVAVRRHLIESNPFGDLVAALRANPSRFFFVSREASTKVLEACPDAEWRLLFALARYGGLRVPSEVLRLKWSDIDWERNRFIVTSPKTEHHDGKGQRVVPIFPELKPYLIEAFSQAKDGAVFCITRYRDPSVNLRTQLQKFIRRAGLAPWPKLWQNLRSTRETELADQFPAHVASAWIGNSVQVATKHYLQITDDHFKQAVASGAALQNPVQQPRATCDNEMQSIPADTSQTQRLQQVAKERKPLQEQGFTTDGRYWTRTSDPRHVTAVL